MRSLRWTAIAGIAGAVLALTASPALAHASLLSSTPAANSTLAAAPAEVALTFDDPIGAQGTQLIARTSGGDDVELGPTQVNGPVVSAAWPASASSGSYVVSYRVVSADGHPVEGSLAFQIVGASPSPTGSPTTASPAPPSPTSSVVTPSPAPSPGSSGAPVALIGALVVAAALAVVAGFVIARRRG